MATATTATTSATSTASTPATAPTTAPAAVTTATACTIASAATTTASATAVTASAASTTTTAGTTASAAITTPAATVAAATTTATASVTTAQKTALTTAIQTFEQLLTTTQQADFRRNNRQSPTVQDVSRLVVQIEEASKNRKSRRMAQKFKNFLDSTQQYCAVADTLVSSNPSIAALVWGVVKLSLILATNFAVFFEKLSESIDRINNDLPRLQQYKEIFDVSHRLRDCVDAYFSVVVSFFAKSVKVMQRKGFLRLTWLSMRSFSGVFQTWEADLKFRKEEIDSEIKLASSIGLTSIKQHQLLEYADHKEYRREAKDNQASLQTALKDMNQREIMRAAKEDERRSIKVYAAIINYDYTAPLRLARESRCAGTGSWFVRHSETSKWMDFQGKSRCLWLRGSSGHGKSTLASFVIDHILSLQNGSNSSNTSQSNIVVLYHIFTSRWSDSLAPETFVRSLIHQILSPGRLSPWLIDVISELFINKKYIRTPARTDLEDLFLKLMNKRAAKQTFLVIDGLDEALPEDQKIVLTYLMRLFRQAESPIRLFTAAEIEIDLNSPFRESPAVTTIYLQPSDVQADIDLYLETIGASTLREEMSGCSPELIAHILDILSSKADGMFLWVVHQIRTVCDVYELDGTPARIHHYLENIPRTIQELYTQKLNLLRDITDGNFDFAKSVFQWLTCARRPLSLVELEEAVTIEPLTQKKWKAPTISFTGVDGLSRLSKRCGNLVTLNKSDGTISLSHHSVKTYLMPSQESGGFPGMCFTVNDAERYLGDVCMTYLHFADFESSLLHSNSPTLDSTGVKLLAKPLDVLDPTFRNSSTAQVMMLAHRNIGSSSAANFDVMKHLRTAWAKNDSKDTYVDSFKLLEYCSHNWYRHYEKFGPDSGKGQRMFHALATEKRLPFQFRPWKEPPSSKGPLYYNIFLYALAQPSQAFFDVWECTVSTFESFQLEQYWLWFYYGKDGNSVFKAALTSCDTSRMNRLFQDVIKNENLIQRSLHALSPWMEGLNLSHLDLTSDLSEALFQAIERNQVELSATIMKYFLLLLSENNPDAQVRGKAVFDVLIPVRQVLWLIALIKAIELEHEAIVTMLVGLDKIIPDLIPKHQLNNNAMHRLSQWFLDGQLDYDPSEPVFNPVFIEWLQRPLHKVVTKHDRHIAFIANPLTVAAKVGHVEILKLLLEKGFNTETADIKGSDTVRVMLKDWWWLRPENVKESKKGFHPIRNALQVASAYGHVRVVSALLQAGADVNAAADDECKRTALQEACARGFEDIIQILLEAGADLTAPSQESDVRNALHTAFESGHRNILDQLLLKGGLNSSLAEAARLERLVVMTQLLRDGANINEKTGSYTPLQAACESGKIISVKFLLDRGADVNFTGASAPSHKHRHSTTEHSSDTSTNDHLSEERSPLEIASARGFLDIVDILLEAGADVNFQHVRFTSQDKDHVQAQRRYTKSALALAAENNHFPVVDRLLEVTPQLIGPVREIYDISLLPLCASAKAGHLSMVSKFLSPECLECNPSNTLRPQLFLVALLQAAGKGHEYVVACLESAIMKLEPTEYLSQIHLLDSLEVFTSKSFHSRALTLALGIAIIERHREVVYYVVGSGRADLNHRFTEQANDFTWILLGSLKAVDYIGLIEGMTPLHLAVLLDDLWILRVLLNGGANPGHVGDGVSDIHELSPMAMAKNLGKRGMQHALVMKTYMTGRSF